MDATLTPARQPIEENMIEFLKKLSKDYHIGAVGGSDFVKIKEQLGNCTVILFNYSNFVVQLCIHRKWTRLISKFK